MPIRRFLDGHHRFDPETVRLMGLAFEMALASLRPAPDYTDPVREVIARQIIELAEAGERRFTAGASGFFILSQSGERPER